VSSSAAIDDDSQRAVSGEKTQRAAVFGEGTLTRPPAPAKRAKRESVTFDDEQLADDSMVRIADGTGGELALSVAAIWTMT
jgi:hypothetical protein